VGHERGRERPCAAVHGATVGIGPARADGRRHAVDRAGADGAIHARHTAGHYALVLSSGDERAYLLGDAVECPLQLEEPDFAIISDMDRDLASRTREAMWRELEGTPGLVGAAHFPGLQLGRVLPGEGRRYFQIG